MSQLERLTAEELELFVDCKTAPTTKTKDVIRVEFRLGVEEGIRKSLRLGRLRVVYWSEPEGGLMLIGRR